MKARRKIIIFTGLLIIIMFYFYQNNSIISAMEQNISRDSEENEKYIEVSSNNTSIFDTRTGNPENNGMAVEHDEFIYYINRCGDAYGRSLDKLFKMKTSDRKKQYFDDKGNVELSGNGVSNLNIKDETIYYCDWISSSEHGIFKINFDGTSKKKISDEAASDMTVRGNWIYYIRNTNDSSINDNNLYKMSTDGRKKIKLNNDDTENAVVSDDWIFYSNASDNNRIYKIKTDGTERTKVCDDDTLFLTVHDKKIYYSNNSDRKRLYVINTNGNGRKKLLEDKVTFINATNKYIYYCNGSDGDKLYRTDINGSQKTRITNCSGGPITILRDKIYYGEVFYDRN